MAGSTTVDDGDQWLSQTIGIVGTWLSRQVREASNKGQEDVFLLYDDDEVPAP